MKTVLPREQAVEDIFSRILASPEASGRLRKVFYQYLDDEHMLVDEDPDHILQVLFILLPYIFRPDNPHS